MKKLRLPTGLRSSLMRCKVAVWIVAAHLTVLGCVTKPTAPPVFAVNVSSLAAGGSESFKTYVLVTGTEGAAANDLQFMEYAKYVERVLSERGFQSVTSSDTADMAIVMNYGIGEPQTTTYSYSLPVWGRKGGGRTTFNASTCGAGGCAHTTGTAYQQPTYGVVGAVNRTGTVTTYFRYLILEAVDLGEYRRSQAVVPIWKTTITSSGSSGDLRRVMPILVAAGLPYIATDTGQQIELRLYETDDRVLRVKADPDQDLADERSLSP